MTEGPERKTDSDGPPSDDIPRFEPLPRRPDAGYDAVAVATGVVVGLVVCLGLIYLGAFLTFASGGVPFENPVLGGFAATLLVPLGGGPMLRRCETAKAPWLRVGPSRRVGHVDPDRLPHLLPDVQRLMLGGGGDDR